MLANDFEEINISNILSAATVIIFAVIIMTSATTALTRRKKILHLFREGMHYQFYVKLVIVTPEYSAVDDQQRIFVWNMTIKFLMDFGQIFASLLFMILNFVLSGKWMYILNGIVVPLGLTNYCLTSTIYYAVFASTTVLIQTLNSALINGNLSEFSYIFLYHKKMWKFAKKVNKMLHGIILLMLLEGLIGLVDQVNIFGTNLREED